MIKFLKKYQMAIAIALLIVSIAMSVHYLLMYKENTELLHTYMSWYEHYKTEAAYYKNYIKENMPDSTLTVSSGSTRSWRGSSNKTTNSFEIKSGEWKIKWRTANESVLGILMVTVYDKSGNYIDMPINAMGNGQDETMMYTGPGDYYLDISAANIDWTISIEE